MHFLGSLVYSIDTENNSIMITIFFRIGSRKNKAHGVNRLQDTRRIITIHTPINIIEPRAMLLLTIIVIIRYCWILYFYFVFIWRLPQCFHVLTSNLQNNKYNSKSNETKTTYSNVKQTTKSINDHVEKVSRGSNQSSQPAREVNVHTEEVCILMSLF